MMRHEPGAEAESFSSRRFNQRRDWTFQFFLQVNVKIDIITLKHQKTLIRNLNTMIPSFYIIIKDFTFYLFLTIFMKCMVRPITNLFLKNVGKLD